MASSLEQARAAFARREWAAAFSALSELSAGSFLDADDYERLAVSAYLVGRDDDAADAWQAAHRARLESGDPEAAARCACWLGLILMLAARMTEAGAWFSRAEALVKDRGAACAASSFVLIPQILGAIHGGQAAAARDMAVQAIEIARATGDVDVGTFATLSHGQALIGSGDVAAGMQRLDEVMVSVMADEVGPIATGIVYCAVLLECMGVFDMRRAAEWTAALSRWCDAQPDMVPHSGQCLVHRSQLDQAAGEWAAASESIERACQRLTDPPHVAAGAAFYQQAELKRLVGSFDEAEEAYRQASRWGQHPMPGLALLQLARGDVDAAVASIRLALQETTSVTERPALLAAAVDILRDAGDIAGARAAADELSAMCAQFTFTSELLQAMSAHALGAVATAEGDPVGGLAHLRSAGAQWHALRMPYEAARTAVVRGMACAALGDTASAILELENAKETFEGLGAQPDLERVRALTMALSETPQTSRQGLSLSAREREVLTHLAAGRTNREIAAELVISEHTVGRHVEHIFAKLGVTNRAAATAYAYEHQLL